MLERVRSAKACIFGLTPKCVSTEAHGIGHGILIMVGDCGGTTSTRKEMIHTVGRDKRIAVQGRVEAERIRLEVGVSARRIIVQRGALGLCEAAGIIPYRRVVSSDEFIGSSKGIERVQERIVHKRRNVARDEVDARHRTIKAVILI